MIGVSYDPKIDAFLDYIGQREYCYAGNTPFVPLTDREENSLWIQACKNGISCHPSHLQMLLNSEFVAPFNPFMHYLDSLSVWDGTDHIGRLASTVHTGNDDFFREGFPLAGESKVIYFMRFCYHVVDKIPEPEGVCRVAFNAIQLLF